MNKKLLSKILLIILIISSLSLLVACDDSDFDEVKISYFEGIEGLKDSYSLGTELDFHKLKVTAVMSDGTKREFVLNDSYIVNDKLPDLLTAGDKELVININGTVGYFGFKIVKPSSLIRLNAPQDLLASGNKLTWRAVSNASSYEIYIDDIKSGVSKTNSYVFSVKDSSTTVKFKVKAIANANTNYTNSNFSKELMLEGITKLNSPTNLSISNGKLSWEAPVVDANIDKSKIYYVVKLDDGIVAGNIEGSQGNGSLGVLTATSVIISNLNISPKTSSNDTPYKLSVIAYSFEEKVMRSNDSEKVSYLTYRLNVPQNVDIAGRVISWNAVSNATSYDIVSGHKADNTFNIVATVSATNYTLPESLSTVAGISKYQVIAKGNGTNVFDSFASSEVVYTVTKLTPPKNLSVSGKVLSWTAISGADKYEVYFKGSNDSNFELLCETIEQSVSLESILNVGKYDIKIKAIGNGINILDSEFSNKVEYLLKGSLSTPVISIEGSLLSWDRVENADYYVLSTQKGTLKTSIIENFIDLNEFDLNQLPYGEHTLTLSAKTTQSLINNSDISNAVNYAKKLKLDAPSFSVEDGIISWNAVSYNGKNATYEIKIIGQEADINGEVVIINDDFNMILQTNNTSFDLTSLNAGIYDIHIRAVSENETVYPYSDFVLATEGYQNYYYLQTPSNFNINMPDGDISWDIVNHAVKYQFTMVDSLGNEVYINDEALSDIELFSNSFKIEKSILEKGEYKVIVRALKNDDLPDYIISSKVADMNYIVSDLEAPVVEITDILTNGTRTISWNKVDYAIGYKIAIKNTKTDEVTHIGNLSIDEIHNLATVGKLENGDWIAPNNSYSLSYSEYAFVGQEEYYEVYVTAIGNCTNRYDSAEGVTNYKKIKAEGVPQNLHLEHGKLMWDNVEGAYRYKVTVKTNKGIDPETSEIKWGDVISIYTFNNYYEMFSPVNDYLVEVQFTVRDESVGTVDVASDNCSQLEFSFNQKPTNAMYQNGVLSWNAEQNAVYKIIIGNYSANITATDTEIVNGIMSFSVLNYVSEYDAGKLDMGVSLIDNGSGRLESPFSMVTTFLTKLESPKLNIVDGLISWNAIVGANGYLLTINGVEYELTSTSKVYNIFAGEHTISIMAKSNIINFFNSDLVIENIYKLTVPDVMIGDGFLYWQVEDDAEYVVKNIETESYVDVDYYFENGKDYAKAIDIGDTTNYAIYAIKDGCYNSDTWQSLPSNVPEFEVGNGTSGSPYEIRNSQQLKNVGKYEGYYKLVTSINMNGAEWEPIVLGEGRTFDGNGLTISNFNITRTASLNSGLFSVNRGTIKNLNLKNVNIKVANTENKIFVAGGLVGINNGVIDGVTIDGGSICGSIRAGGLVGRNSGLIRNCESNIKVYSNSTGGSIVMIGGLVGECYNGIVDYSCSFGEVYTISSSRNVLIGGLVGCFDFDTEIGAENSYINACYSYSNLRIEGSAKSVVAGGLIGQIKINTYIANCLAKGDIVADNPNAEVIIGGLIGYSGGTVINCLAFGAPIIVNAKTAVQVGGFFGGKAGPDPINSFYNVETSSVPAGSNYTVKLGLTNYQFKLEEFFDNFSSDFWVIGGRSISDGGLDADGIYYPHLINEKHLMEIITDDENNIIGWKYSKSIDAIGSIENPILIDSKESFYATYAVNVDWCYSQTQNLDYNGAEIEIVPEFSGTYFGNGYSLNNFKITENSIHKYVGLIAENFGNIYNLGIKNAHINVTNVNDDIYIGGLVGYNGSGILDGCFVINDSTSGIVGKSEKGFAIIGGLVGYNDKGIVQNSYTRIAISGSSHTSKQGHMGGLIGYNNNGYVVNCYSASIINAGPNTLVSGLIGTNVKALNVENIISSYYDSELSAYFDDLRGTPLRTVEMKTDIPFEGWVVATSETSGWVFEEGKYAEYIVR